MAKKKEKIEENEISIQTLKKEIDELNRKVNGITRYLVRQMVKDRGGIKDDKDDRDFTIHKIKERIKQRELEREKKENV